MKIAILTLNQTGIKLGLKLKEFYPEATIYTTGRYEQEEVITREEPFSQWVGDVFSKYEVLCCIMATGIVVRTLAPHMKDKRVDPAVLVLDEQGQFVISLLSGHLGRANEWTIKLAKYLKATPVITTASDLRGKKAIDTLAQELGCGIDTMEQAKELTVSILEGASIGVINHTSMELALEPPYYLQGEVAGSEEIQGWVYISEEAPKIPKVPYVWLMPKNVVVGIGCRKGKPKEALLEALEDVLKKVDIPVQRIGAFATVEIKKDEEGLKALAKELKAPLDIYSIQEIKAIEHQFDASEFVRETIGVGAVSEPCGYLGSKGGKSLIPVEKLNGITISLWKKEL